jgi:hypothetical protein
LNIFFFKFLAALSVGMVTHLVVTATLKRSAVGS